jgi:thioesterase domain-containing protein
VDLVVLFDTFKPRFVTRTPVQQVRNMALNIREHGVRTIVTADRMRKFVNRLLLAKVGLAIVGVADGGGPVDVGLWHAFEDAVREYQYGHYPTSVVLLRAAPVPPTDYPDYSWQGNLSGRFEEYRVRGDHKTLFAPQHAPALAATVTEALNRADRVDGPYGSDGA